MIQKRRKMNKEEKKLEIVKQKYDYYKSTGFIWLSVGVALILGGGVARSILLMLVGLVCYFAYSLYFQRKIDKNHEKIIDLIKNS